MGFCCSCKSLHTIRLLDHEFLFLRNKAILRSRTLCRAPKLLKTILKIKYTNHSTERFPAQIFCVFFFKRIICPVLHMTYFCKENHLPGK